MNSGTHTELLVLVERVRDEAIALLEGLYEHLPELRPAAYDEAKTWDESKHPRGQPDNTGQFASVTFGVSIRPHEDKRAYNGGRPVTAKNRLTNQAQGRLGEQIAAAVLKSGGALDVQENKRRTNYPIDLLQKRADGTYESLEVKTGSIHTMRNSWSLGIGGTRGPAKERMKKLTQEEKDEYRARMYKEIFERKETARKELEENLGIENLQLNTIAVILDQDKKLADVHIVPGVHRSISFNSKLAQEGGSGVLLGDTTMW